MTEAVAVQQAFRDLHLARMTIRLTPTSYIVLGLVRWAPGSTAYELEQTIRSTVSHMWAIQIYREPARLAGAGLLVAEAEDVARPKTRFTVTPAGEDALDSWLAQVVVEMPQMRDLTILKVFFGADPEPVARIRVLSHQARLKEYEVMREAASLAPAGPRRAIVAAIAHERTSIRYWNELIKMTDEK
jgi:PadR family transcriptional regulator AphA